MFAVCLKFTHFQDVVLTGAWQAGRRRRRDSDADRPTGAQDLRPVRHRQADRGRQGSLPIFGRAVGRHRHRQRLMLAVLGGLADVERDLIRTRTAEGRSRARARGKQMGRPYPETGFPGRTTRAGSIRHQSPEQC